MSRFTQLHLLTSYPPANLNRDDLGRPKTVMMGGYQRMRISSQCLKRCWRTSEIFEAATHGAIGTRTKRQGPQLFERLVEGGFEEDDALAITKSIVDGFGDVEGKNQRHRHKQLVHYSPSEQAAIDDLVAALVSEQRAPSEEELELLRERHKAVDIAMFGRMLAASPRYNTEAAVQVAHALTVHEAAIEDDFFTAVDDLNHNRSGTASAHIGNTSFGAGVFYTYVCIDRRQLRENLQGDGEVSSRAVAALTEAATKVAPTGKQNSFASRAYANFALAERGDQQPRSLSVAFLEPVRGRQDGLLASAIERLVETREKMDRVYGSCAADSYAMDAFAGEGSFDDLIRFVSS